MNNEIKKEIYDEVVKHHQKDLKSFLYRFTASRVDAEDLAQETFLKAYQKLSTFRGDSSIKTWLFSIGANLAKDHLRAKARWPQHAQDKCRELISSTPSLQAELKHIASHSETGKYDIKEHIDFCFTCIMKTFPIEKQLILMLAEIYSFKVKEIAQIMNTSVGVIKHQLRDSRLMMEDIFEHRCALISKKGICHQCSELNGLRNEKAETQRLVAETKLAKAAAQQNHARLLSIRMALVRAIDPLNAKGTSLHDFLLKQTERAVTENCVAADAVYENACCNATRG
jgi:RNA polymerase sigma-70 factor, ECF subfamily